MEDLTKRIIFSYAKNGRVNPAVKFLGNLIDNTKEQNPKESIVALFSELDVDVTGKLLKGLQERRGQEATDIVVMHLIESGNLELVKKLVESKVFDINQANLDYHETPLALAAAHGHQEIARYLLDQGADPKIDVGGTKALALTPLLNLVPEGQDVLFDLLVEKGARLEQTVSVEYTKQKGVATQPLHNAVMMGNLHRVQTLLEKGVKADVRSAYGNTPLYEASQLSGGSKELIVQALLEAGADPNAKILGKEIHKNDPELFQKFKSERYGRIVDDWLTYGRKRGYVTNIESLELSIIPMEDLPMAVKGFYELNDYVYDAAQAKDVERAVKAIQVAKQSVEDLKELGVDTPLLIKGATVPYEDVFQEKGVAILERAGHHAEYNRGEIQEDALKIVYAWANYNPDSKENTYSASGDRLPMIPGGMGMKEKGLESYGRAFAEATGYITETTPKNEQKRLTDNIVSKLQEKRMLYNQQPKDEQPKLVALDEFIIWQEEQAKTSEQKGMFTRLINALSDIFNMLIGKKEQQVIADVVHELAPSEQPTAPLLSKKNDAHQMEHDTLTKKSPKVGFDSKVGVKSIPISHEDRLARTSNPRKVSGDIKKIRPDDNQVEKDRGR